jgi:hypothetical protein
MIVPNATYIVVHVHNPEGKELADLEGVGLSDVALFRDDINFADGYYTKDASKMSFLIEPGNHTFKATFNGMSQEQNVTINANETKALTFVFERTEFDLRALLNRVYGGDSVVSYTQDFPALGSYKQGETYWEGNYEITYNFSSYYAIGTIIGYARMKYDVDSYYSKARLSCDIIESVPAAVLHGDISMFAQRWNGTGVAGMYEERNLIPATDKFNRWFVQAVYTGNYPAFSTLVENEGWFALIPGGSGPKTTCQFNARVPHHMLNTFMSIIITEDAGYFDPSGSTEFEDSGSLSFLKMTSVPYDLNASGN